MDEVFCYYRLGVSTRSIYNYHREEGSVAEPCFLTTPLNWTNYERMLPPPGMAKRMGLDTRGRFIEDEAGKRYPARIGVAQRLMGQGRTIALKHRTFSRYHFSGHQPRQHVLTRLIGLVLELAC